MLRITIGSALDPIETLVDGNTTVRDAFRESNVNLPNGALVTLNSRLLGDEELNQTLTNLMVTDGDLLTYSQKLNSA